MEEKRLKEKDCEYVDNKKIWKLSAENAVGRN